MGRPEKNNCDYFSHDNDMRNNRKIKAIRQKFGIAGYAIWCMLLEYLTACDGNRFEDTTIEYELLSGDFGVSPGEIRDVRDFSALLGLIIEKDGFIISESLNNRLLPAYEERARKKRLAAEKHRDNGQFIQVSGVSPGKNPTGQVIYPDAIITENGKITNPVQDKKKDGQKELSPEKLHSEVVSPGNNSTGQVNGWGEKPQSKVKGIINNTINTKERVKRENLPPPVDLSNSNLYRKPVIPIYEDVLRVFLQHGGKEEMAQKFFQKNTSLGWYVNNSPVTNFSNLVPGFITSWQNFEKTEKAQAKKSNVGATHVYDRP